MAAINEPKVVDLGDDCEVKFRIGGVEFSCFPMDDIEAIHKIVLPEGQPQITGEAFLKVCQEQLATHGITASLLKSGQWYDALIASFKEQESFFDGTPDSSGSTEKSAGGSAKKSKRSRKTK
jgi:hypothetical protein